MLSHDGPRASVAFWRTAVATVVTATSSLTSPNPTTGHRVSDAELEAVATEVRLSLPHLADPPAWPAANGPGRPTGL